jgi:integrase
MYAHAAAILGAYCGMRDCEIKGLQWKDVDLNANLLEIRRSKTPAGWRTPTLNTICSEALAGLYQNALLAGAAEPDHRVFPTSWRSAWRSILKAGGIKARFHDLRHTAVTMMAEAGLPDLTIMAQVGHVSPAMMKTYSHIRRQALNQAAAALEPNFAKAPAVAELVN